MINCVGILMKQDMAILEISYELCFFIKYGINMNRKIQGVFILNEKNIYNNFNFNLFFISHSM